ncbi:BON domain-containing protein [Mixta mediterraneensis]|uniref:BON domain-containing protein n=1 Tax=Mixta mediterraneensis TaxID=2758443 RepID=UPI001876C328|nr:BON domain-containing protein [Mixta mediterraneensis]MBE5251820.1 BON domain-containing protein [Mixta mediterraneensis]
MKWFKVLASALIAGVVALTLSACAPTSTKEGTGGYIDDTVITTKVKGQLLKDDTLKSTEINVETFKGKVQLSGFVSSPQMANRAVEVTRNVAGVKSVVNNMQIK